jgi:hypothetical protein
MTKKLVGQSARDRGIMLLMAAPRHNSAEDPLEGVRNSVICGDALKILSRFPSNTVDAVVTSPPYFAQRDYSTGLLPS